VKTLKFAAPSAAILIALAVLFGGCDGSGYKPTEVTVPDPVQVTVVANRDPIDTTQVSRITCTAENHDEGTFIVRRPGGPTLYSVTFSEGELLWDFEPTPADTGVWEMVVIGSNSVGSDRDSTEVLVLANPYETAAQLGGWYANANTSNGSSIADIQVREDLVVVWIKLDVQPGPVQAFCVSLADTTGGINTTYWVRPRPTDCPIVVPSILGVHWLRVGVALTDEGNPLYDALWNARLWTAERALDQTFPSTHCPSVDPPTQVEIHAMKIAFELLDVL